MFYVYKSCDLGSNDLKTFKTLQEAQEYIKQDTKYWNGKYYYTLIEGNEIPVEII